MRIQRNLAHLPSGGPEGVEFFGLVKFKGAPCNFHIEYLFCYYYLQCTKFSNFTTYVFLLP